MRNRSQEKAGKLLLQFNKNQEVPKLVTLRDASKSRDNRNRLLIQARVNHQQVKSTQVSTLHQTINEERREKQQLRSLIRELNFEMQKLKEVNQGLIFRLKEVQQSYRSLRNDLQLGQEEDRRRLKNSIYSDIEEYIKMTIQRLTLSLKQQRMTASLENKLEKFMAELMEINSVSVQQIIRKSRIQSSNKQQLPFYQPERSTNITQYLTDLKNRREESRRDVYDQLKYSQPKDIKNSKELPSKEHYASIMQRLTGQATMSRSYAGAGAQFSSNSKDGRISSIYATTPSKRKRIFQ